MMIKSIDDGLYTENTRVLGVFRYIPLLKHPRTPTKLTYKVGTLRYYYYYKLTYYRC